MTTTSRQNLLLLFAVASVASFGCQNANDVVDDDGEERPPKPTTPARFDMQDSRIAVYDKVRDIAFVAAESVVVAVDLATGTETVVLESELEIVALELMGDSVLVLSSDNANSAVFTRIDPTGSVLATVEHSMPLAYPGVVMRKLDSTTVAIATSSPALRGNASYTIDLDTEQVAAGSDVYHFVYQGAGASVHDGALYLPSAYPGEIVRAVIGDDGTLQVAERTLINEDWLHDVVMSGPDDALVAGHFAGVGIAHLREEGEVGGAAYTHLSDMLWAYSLMGSDYSYSVSNDQVLCIRGIGRTWTLTVPELTPGDSPRNSTRPIGERSSGHVLIHQPGTGIVEVDCTD